MFTIEPISLSIALVLSAAFVFPLYHHSRKNKVAQQKKLTILNEIGTKEGYNWDTLEYWRNEYLIALDKQRKTLAYIKTSDSDPILLDLKKYKLISITEVSAPTQNGGKRIDALYLKLHGYDAYAKETLLEFYNADKFSDLNGELPLAKKWEAICKETAKS
jgi:hypothetical protein